MRRIAAALAFIAGFLPALAAAQAPPPVSALPDTERRTSYVLSAGTCACSVGFQIYGTGTDIDQWIEVWVAGTRYLSTDPSHGWAITSATGSLATIPRPITNAVLTFTAAQTGTVQIVGAERPRRLSQFAENRGVAARDLNLAFTDLTSISRETWDKINDVTGRTIVAPPGDTMTPLPLQASRASRFLAFDASGNPIALSGTPGLGNVVGPASSTAGGVALWADTTGALLADSAAAPGATQTNLTYSTIDGTYAFGSTPINSGLDVRWTYSGAAPAGASLTGPSFYTTVLPSTDLDIHIGSYNGISATVFSESLTVLQQLIGGNFTAIRTKPGVSGSTNPIFGVVGNAVMGDQSQAAANGDGAIGGMFTSYPLNFSAGSAFDPVLIAGQAGVLGRVFIDNAISVASRDSIGVAGYVRVESIAANVYGGWFSVDSRDNTMALAGNAFGINVENVSGAKNLNMAIRTGLGTVQFGGNLVPAGNIVGKLAVTAIGTPVIASVVSGCTGQFSCVAGGSKTYTYKVVAVLAAGLTSAASTQMSTTTGFDNLATAGQNNLITFSAVEGAVGGYNIYRTAAGGTTTNTTGLIGNVPQDTVQEINNNYLTPTAPSFVDSGQVGDSATPPATNTTGNTVLAGSLMVGSTTALTLSTGEIGLPKITASGTAPGAAGGKFELVCGTNAGSAKLIAYAGTSTTPVTILDNIGSGVTGC